MSLAGTIINFMTRKPAARFEEATQNPQQVQEKKLLDMVRKNAATDYGKRYGFDRITSVKDYQNFYGRKPRHVRPDQRHHRRP